MSADKPDEPDKEKRETPGVAEPGEADHRGEPPPVDFSTFVLSLGTTALYQMGLVPDPTSQQTVTADPLVAQQTIATLEMLRAKTLGNLDEEERRLIDSLLYEIRTRFVEITR